MKEGRLHSLSLVSRTERFKRACVWPDGGQEGAGDGIEALKSERNRQKQLTEECDLLRCLSRSEVAREPMRLGSESRRGAADRKICTACKGLQVCGCTLECAGWTCPAESRAREGDRKICFLKVRSLVTKSGWLQNRQSEVLPASWKRISCSLTVLVWTHDLEAEVLTAWFVR
jgi:hypothetical protein